MNFAAIPTIAARAPTTQQQVNRPVRRRIAKMRRQWEEFANDDAARMLHWVLRPGDESLFNAFIAAENHASSANPDLIIPLELPFQDASTHGFVLADALAGYYALLRDDFMKAGVPTGWVPPMPEAHDRGGAATLLRYADSLRDYYSILFRNVILFLAPTTVENGEEYRQWIEACAQASGRFRARFAVLDREAAPAFAAIGREYPDRVRTIVANLSIATMPEEISEAAGGLDAPAGAFRHAFLKIGRLVGEGRVDEAERIGRSALKVAEQAGWQYLAFSIHFALGSAWMGKNAYAQSREHFQLAERAGAMSEERGESFGIGLRVKARLGHGALEIAGSNFEIAALLYESTAPLAADDHDALMEMESWRMAGYAWLRAERLDEAYAATANAIAVGETLDATLQKASTLAFAGDQILQICARSRHQPHTSTWNDKLTALIGPDWRDGINNPEVPTDPTTLDSLALKEPLKTVSERP